MLCGLQSGVHANGALLLLMSAEIHLCHVLGFAGGLETRRRAAVWRQDKPPWPE